MPAAILGPIAGSVVGGLMSGGEESQSASKEPWAPAAPWLKQNIKTGQELQGHYQKNPFNNLQQTGYQNLFSDLDHYRSAMSPALMKYAAGLMGSGFQMPQQAQGQGAPGGLLSPGESLSPRGQAYGLLDFQALNPFTNGSIKPEEATQKTQEMEEYERWKQEQERLKNDPGMQNRFA